MLKAIAALLAAIPFGFGLIRAYVTGGADLRYLWVALAALCGAAALMRIAAPDRSGHSAAVWLPAAVFLSSTTSAALAAALLGTMIGAGMLVVASFYGCCFAAGSLLYLRGRQ